MKKCQEKQHAKCSCAAPEETPKTAIPPLPPQMNAQIDTPVEEPVAFPAADSDSQQ